MVIVPFVSAVVLPSTVLLARERKTPEPFCTKPLEFLMTVLLEARTVPLFPTPTP